MSISTEWQVNNILRLAELMEKEDEAMQRLDFIRDEINQLAGWMSEDDYKKALEIYHKKIGLEPWMEE